MTVEVAVADDGIAALTLGSGDGLNILSISYLRELQSALQVCDSDPLVTGIVLRSGERCFSAGADINEFPLGENADGFLREVLTLLSAPERISKVVVAAVAGSARAGGFELALSCDWIVASTGSTFGLPEVMFGFMPGYCMSRLPFLVGEGRAKRLMLDPGPYSPAELVTLGLPISEVNGASADDEATTICRRMSGGAPESIALVKRLTNRRIRNPDFEPVIAAYNYLFRLDAAAEGVAAFRERRSPQHRPGRTS